MAPKELRETRLNWAKNLERRRKMSDDEFR